MRILFYRYGSICEPDIIDAFKEYGFEITEITKEIYTKNFPPDKGVALVSQVLMDTPHDAVFTINFFPFIAEVCNIMKLRYISWIVDSPVLELYSPAIANPWNRIFLFDRSLYQEIAPMNPDCVFYLPLAVNISQKQGAIQNAPAAQRDKYASEISFVGSLYTEKCPYQDLDAVPKRLLGYLDGLIEAQLLVYGYYFIDDILKDEDIQTFKEHAKHFPSLPYSSPLTDRVIVSQFFLGTQVTVLERERLLKRLSAEFPVDLYTGSDTSKLPDIHAKGLATTMVEMPLIFHESRINLNLTAKSIRSALPLRIWDILGCGGFCLTNYQPEISEYFTVGEEIETYTNEEELVEKCHYYLEHENRRKEIADNAYEKTAKYHTYIVRLCELMELAFAH